MLAYSTKGRQIMSFRISARKAEGRGLTRQEIKAQLAQYVAQQPAWKRAFDRWMKILEIAALVLIAGVFAVAMYVSINHTAVTGIVIATAWFAFPVSFAPLMILIGVHAIGLRAFYPVVLPGKPEQFSTGSRAVWSGLGIIAIALLIAAFWGGFGWAVWSGDMVLIGSYIRVLGTVMGIAIAGGIVLGFLLGLYKQFMRPR
jgi:hypothetical protein